MFGFHGFVVRKLVQEEGFVLVCEVPAIPGLADLSSKPDQHSWPPSKENLSPALEEFRSGLQGGNALSDLSSVLSASVCPVNSKP